MAVNAALGGRVKRREDRRLITGAGTFTDDVAPERCLHAVFVRSPHAHARIAGVDVSEAKTMPGVVGVFRAGDLAFESETARPRLCSDEVKFVGDAVAVAVAEERGQAVDAAAAVLLGHQALPPPGRSPAAPPPGALPADPHQGGHPAFGFGIREGGAPRAPRG